MIVIPPEDPNERRSDPIAEALGPLYDSIRKAQDVGHFYDALVRRDAYFQAQQQHIEENPDQYQNLHPQDFYRQFHRQADEDDKAILSELPYQLRQRLRNALFDERQSAFDRIFTVYRQKFVEHQESLLERDRTYFLNKAMEAMSDPERDRYLGMLTRRLQDSAATGIIHKEVADAAIANIAGDYDTAVFNRDFVSNPGLAQRLLVNGAYPNIRPELRDWLVGSVSQSAIDSESNTALSGTSNDENQTPGVNQLAVLAAGRAKELIQTVPTAPAKDARVKVNEMDTGTGTPPSTQDRPRMRDIEGGKIERRAMDDAEENVAREEKRIALEEAQATDKQNPGINKEGRDFVIWQEMQGKPFAPTIYLDPNKIPTIGYGHRVFKGETFRQPLTREDAERLFEKDLRERVEPFLKRVKVPLSQAQVNALADHIYNNGGGHFIDRILPELNAGNYDKIPGIIAADVGNPPHPGNIRRRRAEADLFSGKTQEPS